jgi:hypothetical protein
MPGPSPFVFDGPLPPDQVIDRQEEVDELRSWGGAGRFVSLYAPRRYGKTSLLGKVAHEAWADDETPVIIVDLYGLASLADLVVRLERAYRAHAKGRFRRAVESVLRSTQLGFSLAGAGISTRFSERSSPDPLPALHAALDLPASVAARYGRRSIIVFDEFQAMMAVEGAEALARSHVQHHRAEASYIFAGSESSLLDAVFADRARPFYGQAEPFRLGRLPDAPLAEAVESGFASTDRSVAEALDSLIEFAEGHPQRAMLAAHCLWSATPAGTVATEESWAAALDELRRRTRRECEALWDRLSDADRRTLRAVVRFGSPYRKPASTELNLARSTAQSAVSRLIRTGDLEEGTHGLRFTDPALADWVNWRFPR